MPAAVPSFTNALRCRGCLVCRPMGRFPNLSPSLLQRRLSPLGGLGGVLASLFISLLLIATATGRAEGYRNNAR